MPVRQKIVALSVLASSTQKRRLISKNTAAQSPVRGRGTRLILYTLIVPHQSRHYGAPDTTSRIINVVITAHQTQLAAYFIFIITAHQTQLAASCNVVSTAEQTQLDAQQGRPVNIKDGAIDAVIVQTSLFLCTY